MTILDLSDVLVPEIPLRALPPDPVETDLLRLHDDAVVDLALDPGARAAVHYERATWLLPVLRDVGLAVETVAGWESSGRPASTGANGPFVGVLNHHTGTASFASAHPTLGLLTRGRSDLPGPLCHLCLARDGVFVIVTAGRANHAGLSNGAGVTAKGDGNSQLIGIEVETSGRGEMTDAQRRVLPVANAAILRHLERAQAAAFLHATTSVTGKWDLAENGKTLDLAAFRRRVRTELGRLAQPDRPTSTKLPVVDLSRVIGAAQAEGRKVKSAKAEAVYAKGVTLVERELVNAKLLDADLVDGYFGPPTRRAYREWQRSLGFTGQDATGIPGMTSLVRLGLRGKDSFKVAA